MIYYFENVHYTHVWTIKLTIRMSPLDFRSENARCRRLMMCLDDAQ